MVSFQGYVEKCWQKGEHVDGLEVFMLHCWRNTLVKYFHECDKESQNT